MPDRSGAMIPVAQAGASNDAPCLGFSMTFHVEVTHGGQKVRHREETRTEPDGSLVYRNLVPTPDGGEFEMIRTVYRRRG